MAPFSDAETRAAIRAAQRDLDANARAEARRARRRRMCTPRYLICKVLIPLSMVIVAVWAMVYFLTGRSIVPGIDPDDLPPFFTDNWGDWGEETGYEGGEGDFGPFQKWTDPPATTDNTGLELTVINALTDEWFTYFSTAVTDWQGGDPRPLELDVRVASSAESECDHIRGVMVACNGNYGRTGWTGLNEVLFERNRIVSSVARMNEFYLRNSDSEERQYTMCHELGHGFGLPHRDETVGNADLGSCLDYTSRPGNNQGPDDVDYANLVGLYGSVPPGRTRRHARHAEVTEVTKLTTEEIFGGDGGGNGGRTSSISPSPRGGGSNGGSGNLGGRWRGRGRGRKLRVLHRSEFGEAYEEDLGDGTKLVTRTLLHRKRDGGDSSEKDGDIEEGGR